MSLAHIAYLLTVQKWNERRLFLRQAPILARAGHHVSFICKEPDASALLPDNMQFVEISAKQARQARKCGSLNLLKTIKRLNPDLIVITCMEQLPLGLVVSRMTSVRVVYDCREDHVSAVRDKHRSTIPGFMCVPLSKIIFLMESLGDHWFDGLVASDPAISQLHSRMPAERRDVFFNVPQKSLFTGPFAPLTQRPFDLAILGSLAIRSGIDYVIEAIGRIKKEKGIELNLLLIGRELSHNPELNRVVNEHILRYGLEGQITETGYLDHDKVPGKLAQAKIGISAQRDLVKFRRNIACKCFEYMACGMPVVCSDLPPQRLFIRDRVNGRFFPPGNVAALMDVLVDLCSDWSRTMEMGRRGRQAFLDQWNMEREAEDFANLFDRILTISA